MHYKKNTKTGLKKNELIGKFILKACLTIEGALEWIQKDTNNRTSTNEWLEGDFVPKWTADVINLIELSMSLHEWGAINHGNVSITALTKFFFKLFGIKDRNIFPSYSLMRTHAKSRTNFLDELKTKLEDKMDRDDEKDYKRKKGK